MLAAIRNELFTAGLAGCSSPSSGVGWRGSRKAATVCSKLRDIDAELETLAANLRSGIVGPTVSLLIGEREA